MSRYAVIYRRPHECGDVITSADVVGTLDEALEIAASVRLNGGTVDGVFKQLSGSLRFTAKLVTEPAPELSPGAPDLSHLNTPASNGTRRVPAARPKGAKRSPGELEKLRSRVLSWIQTNPGNNVEGVAKALNLTTKELALPVKHLLAAKAIKKRGKRRATKYYPVKSSKEPIHTGLRRKDPSAKS
jgi:hypothetical protein